MLDLIIVSGASRGIGASIANKCSLLAKTLIGIGSSSKIFDLSLSNKECQYLPLQLDLAQYNQVKQAISDQVSKINPISIGIVLCAAQLGQFGGLFDDDLENWEKLYKCNVLGNLAVVQGCSSLIEKGVATKIAFFGGGGGAFPYIDFSGYALTKVAIIRAVENIGMEFEKNKYDASIVALAPGFIETDIGKTIVANGGTVRTKTDISEPTNWVYKFLNNEFDSKKINGSFLHVRDNMEKIDFSNQDIYKLRRIQ